MPVPIGVFPSKKAALEFWRHLKTLPDGPLPVNDDAKARSVLAARKWDNLDLGEGVLVMWDSEVAHGERSLWLWFANQDKPAYQVSFPSAINPKSAHQQVMQALRGAVDEQVAPHRRSGVEVDHVYPFSAMVKDWAEREGVVVDELEVMDSAEPNGRCFKRLVDRRLEESWQDFHRRRAQYQHLTPEQNAAKGNRVEGGIDCPVYPNEPWRCADDLPGCACGPWDVR